MNLQEARSRGVDEVFGNNVISGERGRELAAILILGARAGGLAYKGTVGGSIGRQTATSALA